MSFGLVVALLVAAGHFLAVRPRGPIHALSFTPGAAVLVVASGLTLLAAVAFGGADNAAKHGWLLTGTLGVTPFLAAALWKPASTHGAVQDYARWWVQCAVAVGAAAAVTVMAALLVTPGGNEPVWWQVDAPRSPISYAVGAASMFLLLRATTELVRFVRVVRSRYLPQRSHPATRLGGLFYLGVTIACGGVAAQIALGIPMTLGEAENQASLLELVVKSLPSVLSLLLTLFFARFVTASEPSARIFTVLCLLFAVASNQIGPPAWSAASESFRFAALVLAAPVTVHFALVFPHQDEALPRAVAQHWSWRQLYGVQIPWLVYLPLVACLPTAMALPVLTGFSEPPVALLGVVAGTYLLTTLAPAIAVYTFGRTWYSLGEHSGPPEAVQRVREQLAWVALGGLLAAVGSLAWTLLKPLLASALGRWSVTIYWASALLLPLGVALAIVRHRLWDVQRLLNYALVHTATLAIVGLLESAVFGSADTAIKSVMRDLNLPEFYLTGAAFFTAAVIYAPLKALIKKRVDALFARWLRWPARASA